MHLVMHCKIVRWLVLIRPLVPQVLRLSPVMFIAKCNSAIRGPCKLIFIKSAQLSLVTFIIANVPGQISGRAQQSNMAIVHR